MSMQVFQIATPGLQGPPGPPGDTSMPISADFATYPDGVPTGLTSGEPASSFGNVYPLTVSGGRLIHTQPASGVSASYLQANVGQQVTRIGAMVSWPTTGTAGAVVLVLPNETWTPSSMNNAPIHLTVYGNGIWTLGGFDGSPAGIQYYVDSQASTTADTPVKAHRFRGVQDNVPHLLQLDVNKTTSEITVTLPDGSVFSVVNPTWAAKVACTQPVWEIYESAAETFTAPARIHSVWAHTDTVNNPRALSTASDVARAAWKTPNVLTVPGVYQYMPGTDTSITVPTTAADVVAGASKVGGYVGPNSRTLLVVRAWLQSTAAVDVHWLVKNSSGAQIADQVVKQGTTAGEWVTANFLLATGFAAMTHQWITLQHVANGTGATLIAGTTPARPLTMLWVPVV